MITLENLTPHLEMAFHFTIFLLFLPFIVLPMLFLLSVTMSDVKNRNKK